MPVGASIQFIYRAAVVGDALACLALIVLAKRGIAYQWTPIYFTTVLLNIICWKKYWN
jgi:hypothetical protein